MWQRNYRRFFIWLLSPLALIFLILFFLSFLPNGLTFFERPMSSVGVWFDNQWTKFFPSKEGENYCATNESELLVALAVDLSEFEALKMENENLRQQLGFFERQSFQYVPARIIKRSSLPTDDVFVLDRGSDDGVTVGSAVVVSEGHLVGKVIETKQKSSIVQSILGRSSEVAVSLLNSSRTIGLGEGSGGSLLSLLFIPQDEKITINDLVVTSGLEETIPPGLIVGVITGVERDEAAPFQTATIEPLIDSRQFSAVSIIVLQVAI